MKWRELLNPWTALRRAKVEIAILQREQVVLVDERNHAILQARRLTDHNQRLTTDLHRTRKRLANEM